MFLKKLSHSAVSTLSSTVLCSMVVMDYDEFSKDDFIGGTRVNLYELLVAQSNCLTIRRLLDDKKVNFKMMYYVLDTS